MPPKVQPHRTAQRHRHVDLIRPNSDEFPADYERSAQPRPPHSRSRSACFIRPCRLPCSRPSRRSLRLGTLTCRRRHLAPTRASFGPYAAVCGRRITVSNVAVSTRGRGACRSVDVSPTAHEASATILATVQVSAVTCGMICTQSERQRRGRKGHATDDAEVPANADWASEGSSPPPKFWAYRGARHRRKREDLARHSSIFVSVRSIHQSWRSHFASDLQSLLGYLHAPSCGGSPEARRFSKLASLRSRVP